MTDTTTDREIPVHIVMVLDASGSMSRLRSDVIGAVNTFFENQRAEGGKCRVTLATFAPYTVVHDARKIDKVPALTGADYNPTSMTPLLDAEGAAITAAMARNAERVAAGKPEEAVMFVTYTDGHENASHEWTFEKLSELKADRTAAGWTFLYMGAGHDAYGQGGAMGTSMFNIRSVADGALGVGQTFTTASTIATQYRVAARRGHRDVLASAAVNAYDTFGVDDTTVSTVVSTD